METKELRIDIPEGCEIDKKKSTFENIVFKKIVKKINRWEELNIINGCFIDNASDTYFLNGYEVKNCNKNVFLNEKYAKSALALAQISQLLPYYDTNVDWNDPSKCKFVIIRKRGKISIDLYYNSYQTLAFNSQSEAERFLKYNESLVNDFFML